MIGAVLDANAFASGVLGYHRAASALGEVFRRWRSRLFVAFISDHLIAEIERTLADPYFAERVPTGESDDAVDDLRRGAIPTAITVDLRGVTTHPEDDLVLATAVSAAAGYLVTGDRQLLKLGVYEGVTIVTPRQFLHVLDVQSDDAA